ncbi:MAG: protein kinase, partial [Acidobacteriota bacterium]
LSHANIGAIHGLEDADGVHFLVLELIEGETLERRLQRGAIPVSEALEIARQIAEALEAAHHAGIIHRDVKPANVLLTAKGGVKVLDFGIAKSTLLDSSANAALTEQATSLTIDGTLMGTPPYMAPERIRGEEADKRADIWAFGCVVYEMLAGKAAFARETVADTLVAVLEADPQWEALPAAVSSPSVAVLKRCLRKDRHRRLRDIGDARLELEDAVVGMSETAVGDVRTPRLGLRVALPAAMLLVLVAAALGGGVGWMLASRAAAPAADAARLDLVFPAAQEVVESIASPATLSPDGRRVAYVARSEEGTFLYLRPLDSFEATRVAGSEGAQSPFFSPDGQWLGFCADGIMQKVPVGGGPPVTIDACPSLLLGASWGPDDGIVYAESDSNGLWRVPAGGGTAVPLTGPEVARSAVHRFPYQLPDGSGVLFSTRGADGRAQLALLRSGEREPEVVAQGEARFTGLRYLDSGHLAFGQGSTVYVVGFDLAAGSFIGAPRPVITDVASSSISQHVFFSASSNDVLIYVPSEVAEPEGSVIWLDSEGGIEEIARLPGAPGWPRLAPGGARISVGVRAGSLLDPWVIEVAGGRGLRLARETEGQNPVWSPDGAELAVGIDGDLYLVSASGEGEPRVLLERDGDQWPLSWSGTGVSDGHLLFAEVGANGSTDLLALAIADHEIIPLLDDDADESDGAVSPDGARLAYVSDETGRPEVYLQAFPAGTGKQRVSREGGRKPRWPASSERLFYLRGADILAAAIDRGGRPGAEELVVSIPAGASAGLGYDVSDDGERFILVDDYASAAATRLRVVYGWLPRDLAGRRP